MVTATKQQPSDPMKFARDDEAEAGVIGSVLLLETKLDDVCQIVKPEHFYRDDCRLVYAKMLELRNKGKAIDLTLLASALKKAGHLERIGGLAALGKFLTETNTAGYAVHYARIVRENATRRQAYIVGNKIAELANDESCETPDLLKQSDELVFSMRDEYRIGGDQLREFSDVLHEALETIDRRMKGEVSGLETGFRDLDKIIRLRAGELIIVAARPAMGKTALASNIALNVAQKQGGGVLFVSLEMASQELAMRFLASEAQINLSRLGDGNFSTADRHKLLETAGELGATNLITIDETPGRTVWDVAAAARRMARKEKLNLIVIDYLQLLDTYDKRTPRHEQVASQTRALKLLARELKVPVICLAQLNRQSEMASDPKPRLSHLRESGAIEQDADIVLLLHRPGYYDSKKPDGEAVAEIAKNRNGAVGSITLAWRPSYTRFDDHADPNRHGEQAAARDNENWHDTDRSE